MNVPEPIIREVARFVVDNMTFDEEFFCMTDPDEIVSTLINRIKATDPVYEELAPAEWWGTEDNLKSMDGEDARTLKGMILDLYKDKRVKSFLDEWTNWRGN